MARQVRVVVVQFQYDNDDPSVNLRHVHDAIDRWRNHDLIVFPELTVQGHHVAEESIGDIRRALRATPPEDVEALHQFVGECRTRVIFGELVDRDRALVNLATYTDGGTRVSYAKTHVHWTESFFPGSDFPVVETPIGTLGMLICFDAAFPEVPRILALQGAQVIANLSAIPEHFPLKVVHRRLQACSVENGVYTIFANRRGSGFSGGSAVVDPTGEIIAVAGADDPVLEATIDLDFLEEWREREPLLPFRRPELYGGLSHIHQESITHAPEPKTPK